MKLTIDTDKLADTAQWALRAFPGNPPTPVLAGMRLEAADDNTLTLAGFDYYPSARACEDCELSEPGTLLVPGRRLHAGGCAQPHRPSYCSAVSPTLFLMPLRIASRVTPRTPAMSVCAPRYELLSSAIRFQNFF
ncbi:hypothetical protein ACWGLF_18945 [Streptomyces puniciscabiei]